MSFEVLVTKMMTDPAFNDRFHKDATAALLEVGITATPAMLNALNAVDYTKIQAAWAALPHVLKPLN